MKLKTLKDIGFAFDEKGRTDAIIIAKSEIKAEAIKWVKEKKGFNTFKEYHYSKKVEMVEIKSGWRDFCEFHNITEEHLK